MSDRSPIDAALTWRQRSWSRMLRNLVLPFGDAVFKQQMMKRLCFLEQAQWWDPSRIQSHRNRALIELIDIAYREVPFYRQLLDGAGVRPAEIRSAEDLSRIPVVTKAMLRRAYPTASTRATGHRVYEASSSGSTGANFRVQEDLETAGWYRASFLLAVEWSGWQIGQPHLQTGMTFQRSLDRRLKDWLFRCHYVSAADLSNANLDAALAVLEKHRLQYLWGYPQSLYCLAQRASQQGWNLSLRSAVTWGDMLHPHYRRTIEEAFKTRVFDTYGCGEGIQVAAQCGAGNTYHVHSLDTMVDYVNDEGENVVPGEPGNLILTRLHPGPMPLIRYAVGDVGMAGAGSNCTCGRGFDIMDGIQGRDSDIVVTPSGNRLIVHFFTGILEYFREIASFQVIQEAPALLVVRVVPSSGFSPETIERIKARLREQGAADMDIQVETTATIPLPKSQKHRFVISKVNRTVKGESAQSGRAAD